MSYESQMLLKYEMPSRKDVELVLLKTLFKHKGVIKEFSNGEEIVNEIAKTFNLKKEQRIVPLERIYKKENRIVKTPLFHRLLYRAADTLAKEKLITRPSSTFMLTNRKEWMLTEKGYDKALSLLNIPVENKENLIVKSYEVQKIVKKIFEQTKPINYSPFSNSKTTKIVTKEIKIRDRGFRQALIEVYSSKCSVCGLKLNSPDNTQWEVEAAHIIPHSLNGKDDIWNGLALCKMHHWAFDVGWFSFDENYKLILSSKINSRNTDLGFSFNFNLFEQLVSKDRFLELPKNKSHYPDIPAILWHQENILFR